MLFNSYLLDNKCRCDILILRGKQTENITNIINLEQRNKQLIEKIQLINSYDSYHRTKYYSVLEYSIKLLLQNTLIIRDFNESIMEVE